MSNLQIGENTDVDKMEISNTRCTKLEFPFLKYEFLHIFKVIFLLEDRGSYWMKWRLDAPLSALSIHLSPIHHIFFSQKQHLIKYLL